MLDVAGKQIALRNYRRGRDREASAIDRLMARDPGPSQFASAFSDWTVSEAPSPRRIKLRHRKSLFSARDDDP